jgi:UDP-N-acetylmuramate dehydrogenase
MSTAPNRLAEDLAKLPDARVEAGVSLAPYTTFRIGGRAEWLAELPTLRGLRKLLETVDASGAPFFLLGIGSNVLIPDEGVEGVVARLSGHFKRWRLRGTHVSAGGAISLGLLARTMCQRGLTGLEAISGFPSTVGGAVYMNAGSYGTEIKDVLVRATVVDRGGRLRKMTVDDLAAGYRTTALQGSGQIVTQATFALTPGDGEAALERVRELNRRRWASLPSGVPHAGSIFKNPQGDYAGRLIEAVGLKGERHGAAQISEKHANVIVNLGDARASEVMHLMSIAWRRVREQFGVELEPEIVLTGNLSARWAQITDSAEVM